MGRKLAIGLIIVVVIGAGLVLTGGKYHVRLGEHHVGLGHGKHAGHHRKHGGMERTISVSGTGAIITLPDHVHIDVGVRSFGNEAGKALDINNEKMSRIVEGLLSLGLERSDIQTSSFSLDQRTDRDKISPSNSEGLVGYDVKNTIRIKTSEIDLTGEILDKVIGWGATNIDRLYFSVSNQTELIRQARSLAIEDARDTAQQLTEAAGLSLGPILLINEANSRSYRETSSAREVSKINADVPIFMTQERVSTGVTITFGIQ